MKSAKNVTVCGRNGEEDGYISISIYLVYYLSLLLGLEELSVYNGLLMDVMKRERADNSHYRNWQYSDYWARIFLLCICLNSSLIVRRHFRDLFFLLMAEMNLLLTCLLVHLRITRSLSDQSICPLSLFLVPNSINKSLSIKSNILDPDLQGREGFLTSHHPSLSLHQTALCILLDLFPITCI